MWSWNINTVFAETSYRKANSNGHALDPCAVIIVGNWKATAEEQVEQQYFCHIECFKRLVESNAPVDLEELASEAV